MSQWAVPFCREKFSNVAEIAFWASYNLLCHNHYAVSDLRLILGLLPILTATIASAKGTATALHAPPKPISEDVPLNSEQVTLTGIVAELSPTEVLFRTADQDIKISLKELPEPFQKALHGSPKEIQPWRFPEKAIISRTDVAFGIRPDCTELPLSVGKLDSIANSSSDQIDFLRNIPGGTLSTFTFVTHSLSSQRGVDADGKPKGDVRPLWPRVVRTSIDGKLTLTYVCDPENPSYGKVEAIYYDDATDSLQSKEYSFHNEPGVGEGKRVLTNSSSCIQCHGTTSVKGVASFKHVWNEYSDWGDCVRTRGIALYGSNDDNMGSGYRKRYHLSKSKYPDGCTEEEDIAAIEQEKTDYQNFKRLQKDNPCYQLLPWPKIPPGKEQSRLALYYPYADDALGQVSETGGDYNFSRRANLRITKAFSHLQAKRITKLMKDDPSYNAAKYFLAMEGAHCREKGETDQLVACLGMKLDRTPTDSDPNASDIEIHNDPKSSLPILFNYGKFIGMDDSEWNLEFKLPGVPSYRMGTAEVGIADLVAGEILRDIGKKDPSIATQFPQLTDSPETSQGGKSYRCLDDVSAPIAYAVSGISTDESLCTILRTDAMAHLDTLKKEGKCNAHSASLPSSVSSVTHDPLDPASVERGRKLAMNGHKGNCTSCHSPTTENSHAYPKEILFLPSGSLPASQNSRALALLKGRGAGNFFDSLKTRLVTLSDMPPKGFGQLLTPQDKTDLQSYFRSLIDTQR